MIDNLLILPVISHLFIAIILLLFWRKTTTQKIISAVGSLVTLVFATHLFIKVWDSGILTMNAANWDAPFGIVFVADLFSVTLVLLCSIAGLAVSVFSTAGISNQRMEFGYFPLLHFLLLGLNGAFLTGDIFNLYVWFEVIIISSFVLMTLGGRKAQIEGAVKYMAMNILASMIFLTGIGILYGLTGTLNMADLSLKVAEVQNRTLVNLTAIFFIVGFGIKSAIFPLYFWLPSSYHTPPSAVAAIFGGLLTKVGIYALFRFFTLIFIPDDFIKTLFMVLGIMTILTGAFGALTKHNIRRIFSYFIVCHLGYMIGGLGMYTEVALMGALFYLIHDIMIKTNLFLVSGLIRNLNGSTNIDRIGGMYAQFPKISLLIAIVLFSLVGTPPLSGFWPKINLFAAAFDTSSYFFVGALIVGSFVTLFVIAKLWAEVFWKNKPEGGTKSPEFMKWNLSKRTLLIAPIAFLAIVSLYLGFAAEHIFVLVERMAGEMMNTSYYIQAVLGNKALN